MNKETAERRSISIHNTASFLGATLQHVCKDAETGDPDAVKLKKDITDVIRQLKSIEYDLDKIPDFSKIKKEKIPA